MQSTIPQHKVALRISVRKTLDAIPPQDVRLSDRALFDAFVAQDEVRRAQNLFLFWGITGREPDTSLLIPRLLEMGKTVYLPRVMPGRGMEARLYDPQRPLQRNGYGICEPDASSPAVDKGEIELALVPAMCYDRSGFRLGYGAGYYDRWLSGFTGYTVGLCRERVLQRSLPVEPHDLPVNLVLTERQVLRRD